MRSYKSLILNFFYSKIQLLIQVVLVKTRRIKECFLLLAFIICFCIASSAQNAITGVVINTNNNPLEAATILNTTTNVVTISAKDGSFSIAATKGDVMQISFIGYAQQQVTIGDDIFLTIQLHEFVSNLDNVVTLGYTKQKVKEITGAVAVVKPKDLTAVPAGQVEQMLQGRVAGLNIITSGEPGASANIRIHGIGNFGDVTPLYVIDGVQGSINNVNPDDIESLQVLKDAGSYSIYGVRGANGVIIVTTKKGSDKSSLTYNSYIGLQEPLKNGLNLLSPQENANLEWLSFKNSNQTHTDPLYGDKSKPILPDYIFAGSKANEGLFEGDPLVNRDKYSLDSPVYQIVRFNKTGTDWFHELFKPVFSQNHSIAGSGGNNNNHYLFSLGYLDQNGTYVNTFLKRLTARINTDFNIKNIIRFGENLQLAYLNNQQSDGSIWLPLINTPSYLPVYDLKGNWSSLGDPSAGPTTDNPLASQTLKKDDRNNNWQMFGNAFAELKLFKYLTARTSIGGSFNYFYEYNYSYGAYDRSIDPSKFTENSGYLSSYTWTNTLNFSKTFSKKHRINALIGTEAVSNYNRSEGGTASGYFTNNPDYRFLSNGTGDKTNYSGATYSYLSSFISQLQYAYNDKYFFSGTLRRDGSSIFGPQQRFGWFPSISGAWRITQENFFQDSKWLNEFKLRASWGKTGFDGNTDPLNQFTLYGGDPGTSFYDIFGTSNSLVQGFTVVRIGNPSTGWEQDVVSNIGFESVLWNGFLSITADAYQKKSKGLLFQLSLPDILGSATRPNANVGDVENEGIDILVNSKGNFSKNLGWNADITFTTYKNKIIKLNDIPYFEDVIPFTGSAPLVRNEVGHPIGSFYGYKIIDFFNDGADVSKSPVQQDAAPGRFKYFDANHDDTINDKDRIFIGNPNPKFTLGINLGLTYKQFDFSTFMYGSFGNDVYNALKIATDIYATAADNPPTTTKSKTALYDSWTPEHTNAKAPIAEMETNFSNVGAPNSYGIENGSYLRDKSFIIGYTFSKNSLQKFKINQLRVYVQVVNLFTITKYSGLDPELAGNSLVNSTSQMWGYDPGNYPANQKQYLLGVTMNF